MAENILNLVKDTSPHIKEAERIPQKIIPKKSMLRHTLIKLLKTEDKIKISCHLPGINCKK